jgi:hypothetical protein
MSQKTTPPFPDCSRGDRTVLSCPGRGVRRFLHVLEPSTVLERRGDEYGAHRVRRVAAIEPKLSAVFPRDAIDPVGVHMPALLLTLAVVLRWSEQRSVDVGAV